MKRFAYLLTLALALAGAVSLNLTASSAGASSNPLTKVGSQRTETPAPSSTPPDFTNVNDILSLATIQATVQSTDPLSLNVSLADQTTESNLGFIPIGLQNARLDFFAPTEQAVLGETGEQAVDGNTVNYVAVLSFDPDLKISIASSINYFYLSRQVGIAVGNFDQATDPNTPLNLQIASLALNDPDSNSPEVYMLPITVDASNNFKLTLPSASDAKFITRLVDTPGGVRQGYIPRIASGDLQGRSILLGEPTKITVEHVQPRLVLGTPPMHVDWVKDADGNSEQALNLSAALGTFNTSYQTAVTNQAQSSSKSTTSWTHAVSETASLGYTWGNAATGTINVKVTESSKYLHENTVSKQYNTYQSTAFDVSAATGFDDVVWFNDERHNVYIYPIIGQTACPADKPNCSDSERLPLTLVLSGPDQIEQEAAEGGTLEWFQPVWEPGNIFSYPWDLTQLQAQYPKLRTIPVRHPAVYLWQQPCRRHV